jgi:alkanesulfonate monooxygenase SsuD/methylene tetrahydromethanopterin reductase-like flavin-dependent oxidoreductase (luciferase family)
MLLVATGEGKTAAHGREDSMTYLAMRHDFRAPAFGPASVSEIYSAALEQYDFADRHCFDAAVISEHHGVDDGWMPAPLSIAGVVLGRTRRIMVTVSAAIVPLHDPVRLAEQIAVLHLAAGDRLSVIAGAGYREEEFEMAGVDKRRRGKLLEEYVGVMLAAWTGEPFEYRGRTIVVTPVPETRPMLLMGGGTEVAARRAARLGLPLFPMHDDPILTEAYEDEASKLGVEGGFVVTPSGPTFVHVTDDPERTWSQIAPYLLYEAQTYASFQPAGQHSNPLVQADTVDDLKRSPQILVGTPDDIVAASAATGHGGAFVFHPLAGGLPPDLAWESLELFVAKVLPRISVPAADDPDGIAPGAAS